MRLLYKRTDQCIGECALARARRIPVIPITGVVEGGSSCNRGLHNRALRFRWKCTGQGVLVLPALFHS